MRSTNDIQSAADCIRTICKAHDIQAGNIPMTNDTTGIIGILKTFGFYAAEIHTDMHGLADCPKPVIVQTVNGYMTILNANNIGVKISFGNNEVHRIAFPDFIKIWTGLVIVIEPPPTGGWSFFRKIFS